MVGSMVPTWKKAIGKVKDQTSIGLARVSSSRVTELDVAIVKATSHDEMAVDEKYVQGILRLAAISHGYANACLQALTKRIRKTHNWIVAIKVLVLTHRILREGNPAFEEDLRMISRRNLNLTNFRDDSHANAWDYSAFVRSYAAYIDARLDCFIFASQLGIVRSHRDEYNFGYGRQRHSFNDSRSSFNRNAYDADKYREPRYGRQEVPVKEMEPDMLIELLPDLQRMLERVLACRPTGAAKNHRLVQSSLYMILRESFQIYSGLCEGIGALLNVYFDMRLEDSSRIFHIYVRYAKQSHALSAFYNISKGIGICRPCDYPPVEKVSQHHLENLEDSLRDRSGYVRSQQPTDPSRDPSNKNSPGQHSAKQIDPHRAYESTDGMKALPAPPTKRPQIISNKPNVSNTPEKQTDLIDLGDARTSPETTDNKSALALLPSSTGANTSNSWATFDIASTQEASQIKSTATSSQLQASIDPTKSAQAGWELALVSEASSLANVKPAPTLGKMDRFLFESLYEQASWKPDPATTYSGSASSVAVNIKRPTSPYMALPAPAPDPSSLSSSTAAAGAVDDPFAASATIAPPTYVQLADLKEKQRLLLQEQQLWAQSQTYGQFGLMQFYSPSTPPFRYGVAGYAETR